MIRKPRPSTEWGWQRWGTPYLQGRGNESGREGAKRPLDSAGHLATGHDLSVTAVSAPGINGVTGNYEALRLALLAEEQRQVFAVLNRLRQSRRE